MSSSDDDGPNNQLRDDNLTPEAPNAQGSDDGIDGDEVAAEMDDLFGDDEVDEEAEERQRQRQLDDEDLDSGDDVGRTDRVQRDEEPEPVVEEDYNVLEVDHPRHPIPDPSDGENYLLKVPQFISIDPVAFDLPSFQPPQTDHHSDGPPTTGFSAYKTAQTTVRWRHSPSNPAELQSNARFLRWSDGSLTMQLASDPTAQYEITPKALAPPQRNPVKPTPVSIKKSSNRSDAWNEKSDSFTYLASASNASYMIRVTNKITASLVVMPSNDGAEDEALERLQVSMAASRGDARHMIKISAVAEDPELAKKKAEQAEREKMRAQRRLEQQQIREKERASRVFGRPGGARSGLTVGGLEDEDTGGRGGARAPRAKPARRRPRNDEYSDEEEEYYGRRRGKEDDYDEEDDFIAASDEDEDRDAEGEEDDIDAMIESREKEQRDDQRARAGTPKRDRPREEDADADAEHDSPVSRQKRRRVVEDDDDDE